MYIWYQYINYIPLKKINITEKNTGMWGENGEGMALMTAKWCSAFPVQWSKDPFMERTLQKGTFSGPIFRIKSYYPFMANQRVTSTFLSITVDKKNTQLRCYIMKKRWLYPEILGSWSSPVVPLYITPFEKAPVSSILLWKSSQPHPWMWWSPRKPNSLLHWIIPK